tara:strand:+ start:219 stop:1022 length:804 start_codon:yes stop_codon:yes gene_type:complete
MSHAVISLGLGLGGGKASTSSGGMPAAGGGGTDELNYPTGIWSSAGATYYIGTSPDMHFDASILDGADAGNNPANGAAVSAWGDRSGNATDYDATQASASSQPTFADAGAGPGSKPAVTWATDELDVATGWAAATSCTAIYVSQATGSASNVTKGGGYSYSFWFYLGQDWICGNAVGDYSTPNDFNMHTIHRDGTSVEFFESGGTSLYGPATDSSVMEVEKIGITYASHAGTISEILIFASALSTADLNVIRLYIANKYGLTTAAFS